MQRVGNPVPLFLDTTGRLMDGGKIYVGVQDGDPQTNPIIAYFDSALTIVAPQPIRTVGGFIVNVATPASIYVAEGDYSMRVLDSLDNLVEYSPSVFAPGASFQPLSAVLTDLAALALTEQGEALLESALTYVDTTTPQTVAGPKTLTNPGLNGATLDAASIVSDAGTIATNSVGFRGMPTSGDTQGSLITLAAADNGKRVPNTTGGWSIPANASLALPVGFTCVLYNDSGSTQTVAITTDTLRLHGSATTGTRTVAIRGFCTLVKVNTTEWVATGDVS